MLPKISHVFRLYKDPEIRYLQDNKAVCKLGLVASEKYGEKENQFFIDATAWGKTAELLNMVRKGQRVFISGRLQTDSWEKDGQKQSKPSLVVESFDYIEKREQQEQQSYQQQQQDYRGHSGSNQNNPTYTDYQPQQRQQNLPSIDIDEDEIPFGYIGLEDKRILHII